jgi:mRNA-degrading endonuclease toxin of MazEF toxin-antitoxin module
VLGLEDGMPCDCALNLDNVAAMPKAVLTSRITRLGTGKLRSSARLNIATGC